MKANFALFIDNIYNSSNDEDQILINQENIVEVPTDRIEDCTIPATTSAVVLFKNRISGRDKNGTAIIDEFMPTDIKQYVITTQEFLNLPMLFAKFCVAKDLVADASGAYVLRDGTLFVIGEELKKLFTPILTDNIDEYGKIITAAKNKE